MYQTLDAIDGKQARRTNSSSPLGELFDHGCDSLSTGETTRRSPKITFLDQSFFAVFVTLAAACAVSLGKNPWMMLFQCFVASALFYCAHWQTYVTGKK